MFDKASATPPPAHLLDRIGDATRAESQAAAERLVAIADLYADQLRAVGKREEWAVDTHEVVAAQVAAKLRVSIGMGESYLRYALAMRQRLTCVGRVFEAGDIDYQLFKTIVFRTGLITDPDALAKVDAQLAVRAPRWPSMTRRKLGAAIDKLVFQVDKDAIRRAKDVVDDRYVEIGETTEGMAAVTAHVFNTVGEALDRRLDAMANSVCEGDPRTKQQRRADAIGAVLDGADRLQCRCGAVDCPAGAQQPPSNAAIYVIAEKATLDGRSDAPGYLPGADSLISAEVLRELAATAKQLPIIPPIDREPETGYVPSRALADYVRCRDLTCRAPGCDQPAIRCDIDHTVPYPAGPTHASNLKCLCRHHHLLKTFWGWRDRQLPDGTVIWTLPYGQTQVTTPGSALLFPALCASTGFLPGLMSNTDVHPEERCGDRSSMMPTRSRTRAQNQANAITEERRRNQQRRTARRAKLDRLFTPCEPPDRDEDPPPF